MRRKQIYFHRKRKMYLLLGIVTSEERLKVNGSCAENELY